MQWLRNWLESRRPYPASPDPTPRADLDALENHVDQLLERTERVCPQVTARLEALRLEWEALQREER